MTQDEDANAPPPGRLSASEREKLASLGQRIETARASRRKSEGRTGTERPAGRPSDMAVAMRLSSELVAGVALGAGIGWFFDWLIGTSPFGLVIFTGLGTVAGVRNVLRATQNMGTGAAQTGIETGAGDDAADAAASPKDRQDGSNAGDNL